MWCAEGGSAVTGGDTKMSGLRSEGRSSSRLPSNSSVPCSFASSRLVSMRGQRCRRELVSGRRHLGWHPGRVLEFVSVHLSHDRGRVEAAVLAPACRARPSSTIWRFVNCHAPSCTKVQLSKLRYKMLLPSWIIMLG